MTDGRRVLLTGATGLIGRPLAEHLTNSGHRVTALVRPETQPSRLPAAATVHELDLTSAFTAANLPSGPFDAVIHLAQHPNYASFPTDAGQLAALNVGAACRLAEYATSIGASQFLFASSGGIYGSASSPVDESARVSPPDRLGFYLTAKAAAERLLAPFRSHLDVTFLRYFFVYGPHQDGRFLLPRLIERVRRGEPITVARGRGPRINPIHVDDAAAATAACVGSDPPEAVNIAGPTVRTIREIATRIGALVGREPQLIDLDEEPDDLVADTDRLREMYTPVIDLDRGIADLCGGDSIRF